MTAIECKDLWLSYGSASVIEGLSFSLESGKCLCIAGENGTGKSTLIKALLGLKDASRGEIVFFGGEKKHGIGYLPQRSDAQSDFPASVWEVVLSGKLTSGKRFPFHPNLSGYETS